MGRKKRYSAKEVADALELFDGMVYVVARNLKTTHTTIYRYIRDYKICAEAKEKAEGFLLDMSESALRTAVLDQRPWAVKFMLKTKGKERGYEEHVHHDIDPALIGSAKVEVYIPDNNRMKKKKNGKKED